MNLIFLRSSANIQRWDISTLQVLQCDCRNWVSSATQENGVTPMRGQDVTLAEGDLGGSPQQSQAEASQAPLNDNELRIEAKVILCHHHKRSN